MTATLLVLSLLLVIANGFFVAAEFAIVKVRPSQLAPLAAKGSSRARMAEKLTSHLDAYLSATQLGITLASLALGWIGEPTFAHMLEPLFKRFDVGETLAHSISLAIAFTVITILHIVFGELAPKSLAIQKPVATSLWVAHLLHWFFKIMYPAIWLLNGLSNKILKLVGLPPATEAEGAHSEEELRFILAASGRAGLISEGKRQVIDGALQFSQRNARQIMVPRTDVAFLSVTNTIDQNLEVMRASGHTRYPLCDGSLDNTVGMIHVKDLFLAQLRGPGRSLLELKRDVLFIPETTSLEQLLEQFQKNKAHMAVVIDEYGGSSGIVSLENVVEELFGQIQDEFDRERAEVEPLPNGKYRVRGDYLILDLADRLDVDLGTPAEETIGGYVVAQLGREVQSGDTVQLGSLQLLVLEGERFRVRWVLVSRITPPSTEGPQSGASATHP